MQLKAILPSSILTKPTQGFKFCPALLDFTTEAVITVNLTDELFITAGLDLVQGIFIDNEANANPVTLKFVGGSSEGYRIKCPANAQMWMPVNSPGQSQAMEIECTATLGMSVPVQFVNFPVAPCVWPSATVANVTANLTPITGAFLNRGQLLPYAADIIMAANPARKRFYVQNDPGNANNITLTFASGAAIVLFPGGSYDSAIGPVDDTEIKCTGTAGDKVNAGEM